MSARVTCFGEALIDFHAEPRRDALPAFIPHAGGAPANVAVAVAKLGGASRFVGMFGRDLFADMLLRELTAAGVDTTHARRTGAANTALAFVSHDAQGERDFSFYRPPSADLLFRESDFDPEIFAADSIFHAGSCSMTEPAAAAATLHGMARAREAGVLVSFDMNLRAALWPRGGDPAPVIWQALAFADLVKLSAEELAFLATSAGGETAALERLWSGATSLAVVTDGAGPLRWYTRHATGQAPVFPVRAIDATGAGDAFVGGCLHTLAGAGVGSVELAGFAEDDRARDAMLRFAAACGALAVTRAGSFAAMPTRTEVAAFLEQRA